MDVHRCRFVAYQPQSINALAFSHPSNPKQRTPTDLRLALGRDNGDVEIWRPTCGHWFQERVLAGSQGRTIDQLAWTQDIVLDTDHTRAGITRGPLRLFSSGGSSSLTEWDLSKGIQRRIAEGNSGDIWCFAVQPQWSTTPKDEDVSKIANASSQLIAAGCSNGSVLIFSTADDNLQYSQVLARATGKKPKVISITWRDRQTVVAGYENNTIRVLDVPSRTVVRTMSLGKSADGNIVVWAVRCLSDGTILSGDSTGELKIWDAKNYSLLQQLKTHEADILDLASSTNGDTIFSTGTDRRTVVYEPVASQAKEQPRWQQITHRRYHQHDVKALAAYESKDLSVLVSGGIDTVPVVVPLRKWDREYHRSLSHLPQKSHVSCSSIARLMLTWWAQDLYIWQLPRRSMDPLDTDDEEAGTSNHKLLARVQLKGDENITHAQISQSGDMVVVATSDAVKLFQLRKTSRSGEVEVRTRLLDLPPSIRDFGASFVGFSPDAKWLYAVRLSNPIVMVRIIPGTTSKDKPIFHPRVIKLDRKTRKGPEKEQSKLQSYMRTISCVTFSPDSRILATGDISGAVDAWVLEGHESLEDEDKDNTVKHSDPESDSASDDSDSDSEDETNSSVVHGQKWIKNPNGSALPQLDSAILALSFRPQPGLDSQNADEHIGLHPTRHNPHPLAHEMPPTSKLVAITASHRITEFDILTAKLSDWSRRNPHSCLPKSFTQIRDRVTGMFWDCSPGPDNTLRERLWMYGPTWLYMLDISRDLNTVDAQEKVGQIGKYEVKEPLGSLFKRARLPSSPDSSHKRRKRDTGAGGEIREYRTRVVGMPNSADRTHSRTDHHNLPSPPHNDSSDSEDEMDTEQTGLDNLASLRRSASTTLSKGQAQTDLNSDTDDVQPASDKQSPQHFVTFRYRSIFGAVALAPPSTETANTKDGVASRIPNMEVVIVERPLYDVDLVPRFDSGQDWIS